jgi:DNA-binding NtrC family response regulator
MVAEAHLSSLQREGRGAAAQPNALNTPQASTARTLAEQDTRGATGRSLVWRDPQEASTARPLAARQARRASTASPSVSQEARGVSTAWPPARHLQLHRHGLTSVLILGGSPEDRTRLARSLHRESPNHAGAFVRVEAGRDEPMLSMALQEFLSAAGATDENPIRLAAGGTLFIDSIASLSPPTQRLMLEMVSRTEGTAAGLCRWRLVTGNHADLASEVEAGRFLAPLFDCLDKLRIQLEKASA